MNYNEASLCSSKTSSLSPNAFSIELDSLHIVMQLLLKSNTTHKSLRLRVSHVFSCATVKRVNVSNCNFLPVRMTIYYYALTTLKGGKFLLSL